MFIQIINRNCFLLTLFFIPYVFSNSNVSPREREKHTELINALKEFRNGDRTEKYVDLVRNGYLSARGYGGSSGYYYLGLIRSKEIFETLVDQKLLDLQNPQIAAEIAAGLSNTPTASSVASAKFLHQHGMDLNAVYESARIPSYVGNANKSTPMMRVVQESYHSPEYLQLLLDSGADINQTDGFQRNALFYASMSKNPNKETIKYLLENGASPYRYSESSKPSESPISNVIHAMFDSSKFLDRDAAVDIELIHLFLEAGIPIDYAGSRPVIFEAIARDSRDKQGFPRVQTLIDAGADINSPDYRGNTALDQAIYFKSWDVAAELIKLGGKFSRSIKGRYSMYNNLQYVKLLVNEMLLNNKVYGANGPASAEDLIDYFETHIGRDVAVFDQKSIFKQDQMIIPDCSNQRIAIVLRTGVENHGIKQIVNEYEDFEQCFNEVNRFNLLQASPSKKIGVKITNNYGQNDPFDLYAVDDESVVSEAVVQNLSNPSDTVVPH